MDVIVHSAVEEICSQGTSGLTLSNLWSKLRPTVAVNGLHLCPLVKAALWASVLEVRGLQFEAQGVSYSFERDSSTLNSVEQCEQINLTIVAPERLRNNFVGIYDVEASTSSITPNQRRTLERLAIARTNGIAQSELAKEFGIKGNKFFYILKKLETRGLIVRQSTLLRTKEASCDREPKNTSVVMTNMLYLYRYAKHLGSQKRLEITKEDMPFAESDTADASIGSAFGSTEESRKEDVHVKDYLPSYKAICDKLEEAEGKVLVVSDIKRDLGYQGTKGHRAWRNTCNRLKEAQVVEVFCAKVKMKKVHCLRLLKKFSPMHFEAKSSGSGNGNHDGDQLIKLGKRGQITEQCVELPIEQQIYDLIDSEGSKGLTITEVLKRLGLRNKQYYDRLLQLFTRCGMPLQAESHNRGVAYRVWTSNNFNSVRTDIPLPMSESPSHEYTTDPSHPLDMEVAEESAEIADGSDASTSKDNALVVYGVAVEPEVSHGSTSRECNMPVSADNTQYYDSEPSRPCGLDVSDVTSLEVSPSAVTTTSRRRSYLVYPRLTLAAASAQREQHILKMLEEEKFLTKAEIHRRLEDLEKEKHKMDRKTLERSLNKLQKEGRCKCISFQVPVMTNLANTRPTEVVFHPSTCDECPEILCQKILENIRSFDMRVRRHSYSRSKKGQELPVLHDIQRIPSRVKLDSQAAQVEAKRANGYVRARMVQMKLLHIFLWRYLSEVISFGSIESDLENPHSTWRMFELDAAVKAMPLELYLQVIGSSEKFDNLDEISRRGLRLSDLPLQEYRCLMDTRTMGRLSRLIDILRRLQLIRFVSTRHGDGTDIVQPTTLTHALELKPYIEEPVSVVASYSGFRFEDLRPHMRHDFVLLTIKAVEDYWSTLEYCYADADSEAARHAFPGSAVPEVFRSKAWCSVRGISDDQHAELLKRVVLNDPCNKISYKECEEIAKDLNLTLEQVLRVYHDKRKHRMTRLLGDSYAKCEENLQPKSKQVTALGKRKRSSEQRSLKHLNSAREDVQFGEETFSKLSKKGSSSLPSLLVHACESPRAHDASEDENIPNIHQDATSSSRLERKRKFPWTEAADRQLVIEYVRHRAVLGPKFNRTHWASLPNLPAPPDYCRRRMTLLIENLTFRKAVMRLCNLMADRYRKHLEKFPSNLSKLTDRSENVQEYASFDCSGEFESEGRWDDFDENNIKIALGDALRCKRLAKLDSSEKVVSDEAADGNDVCHPEMDVSAPLSCAGRRKLPARKSSFPLKYSKIMSKITRLDSKVFESVAVSNAVELFKLIFLSTSTSPQASSMLAETLRRYSQHDLFTAFCYLREKKAMVGGTGSKPFVLSQLFLRSIYLSPFPVYTGKRASKFASWLEEREEKLMEEEIDLPADLQCGDFFCLCALVSSGELLVVPCLPEEGVGEVDTKAFKRKNDSSETYDDKSKRMRTSTACESEISRREKGFPNIRLSLNRATIPRLHALDMLIDKNSNLVSGQDQDNARNLLADQSSGFDARHIVETALDAEKSPWDAMCSYTEHLFSACFDGDMSHSFCPELFKSICLAIRKSGDQGLCMKEISKFLDVVGEKEAEIVVEVLETFGQALKVPAFDSIRVVDPLYQSKYFLTPLAGTDENCRITYMHPEMIINDKLCPVSVTSLGGGGMSSMNEASRNNDVVHRVTILNQPNEVVDSLTETSGPKEVEGGVPSGPIPSGRNLTGEAFGFHSGGYQQSSHILPWVNGDGTVNELVYKGLRRRLLGLVMQNPGILEDNIIKKMSALNPQSCRKLVEMMILDKHIIFRRMQQRESAETPSILSNLIKKPMKKKLIYRQHFFANPMSATLL